MNFEGSMMNLFLVTNSNEDHNASFDSEMQRFVREVLWLEGALAGRWWCWVGPEIFQGRPFRSRK